MTNSLATMPLAALVEQLEPLVAQAVIDGTDDELFASGYLRGHFDLVVAQLELSGEATAAHLLPALSESIAATKHELSPADQQHIQNLYQRLSQQAAGL